MLDTREIDVTLDAAYHRAAGLAASRIRRCLRPFNLKRHPLGTDDWLNLTVGGRVWDEISHLGCPVVQAIHEAGRYVARLPADVVRRLGDHL